MVVCGQASATWLPSTMPSLPSTGPSGSRERRSSAFIREDLSFMVMKVPTRLEFPTCLEKIKLPVERILHIDHLFARMQRLNMYEAKTNVMTRIGSHLSQVLPPPFICE